MGGCGRCWDEGVVSWCLPGGQHCQEWQDGASAWKCQVKLEACVHLTAQEAEPARQPQMPSAASLMRPGGKSLKCNWRSWISFCCSLLIAVWPHTGHDLSWTYVNNNISIVITYEDGSYSFWASGIRQGGGPEGSRRQDSWHFLLDCLWHGTEDQHSGLAPCSTPHLSSHGQDTQKCIHHPEPQHGVKLGKGSGSSNISFLSPTQWPTQVHTSFQNLSLPSLKLPSGLNPILLLIVETRAWRITITYTKYRKSYFLISYF